MSDNLITSIVQVFELKLKEMKSFYDLKLFIYLVISFSRLCTIYSVDLHSDVIFMNTYKRISPGKTFKIFIHMVLS